MDDDITYIGISQESKENKTKNKSKDAPPKKEKFKTQKKLSNTGVSIEEYNEILDKCEEINIIYEF